VEVMVNRAALQGEWSLRNSKVKLPVPVCFFLYIFILLFFCIFLFDLFVLILIPRARCWFEPASGYGVNSLYQKNKYNFAHKNLQFLDELSHHDFSLQNIFKKNSAKTISKKFSGGDTFQPPR